MAHFAKIGKGNIVLSVEVVNNDAIMKDGKEDEATGVAFLQNLHDNRDTYIQTSYNNNFRKQYAGVGYTYDIAKDVFISVKPFPSWSLDENSDWKAPKDYPDDGKDYAWDEENKDWELVE